MKCEDVQLWISLALDGELEAEREADLDQHLGSCEACRHRQKAWATQVQLMQKAGVPEGPSPERMWQDVRREIRLYEDSRKKTTRRGFFGKLSFALGLALVLAVGLYFIMRSGTADTPPELSHIVETDIEGAMTMTWVDEDTGITVIWVEEPEEDNGNAG